MLLPSDTEARGVLAIVLAAFIPAGGLDDLQQEILSEVARAIYGIDLAEVSPATPEEISRADRDTRLHSVHLMVVLEFVEHPLARSMERPIEDFAKGLGVSLALLRDARRLAQGHFVAMYLDLQRHSWYERETIRESLRGRWHELVRSKMAYTGIIADHAIAKKWTALRDCPPGSWGRGVADFYEAHEFPFPGERHGIYEIGARHDWVHVLTDYETTPEGELDVFAFIAASMSDERGLVLLAFTLGLFQNGSIHHVAGKLITNARTDTLADAGAVPRWVEAMRRGSFATTDVMGTVDLFAHKDMPLSEARDLFGVVPIRSNP